MSIAHVRELVSVLAPGVPVRRADRVVTLAQLAALPVGFGASITHDRSTHRAEDRYVSFSVRCTTVDDLDGFITAVRVMKPPPLRLKGLILSQGAAEPALVNFENGKLRLEPVTLAGSLTQTVITAVFPRTSNGKAVLESLVQRYL